MSRLWFLALFVPLAAPASAAAPLRILVPGSSYPSAIPREHVSVDVPVKLAIAPDGGLRCTPAPMNDHAALRRPSCALVVERGVFGPNLDSSGQVVPTVIDLVVRWLPDEGGMEFGGALPVSPERWITRADYPLREVLGGTTTVAFTVNDVGRVSECQVVKSSRYLVLDSNVCRLLRERALLLPTLDQAGNRKASSGRFSYRWPFG